jgi:hypothetical protein
MMKTSVHTCLIVAGVLTLVTTGCRTPHFAAFGEARQYFSELKGPMYDVSVLARLVSRMSNEAAIQYLIDRMDYGTGTEPEIAALCLATIYEVTLDNPSAESRKLRETIEKARLLERSVVYADKGSSEAIRRVMASFVKMPKHEELTPAMVAMSGPETWEIEGKKIAIHSTCIYMRNPKGPVFSVVVDRSRNSITRMIDPMPKPLDGKAIAKYALDKGYFRRARETQVAGQSVKLQDRIAIWIGQNTSDGFRTVGFHDGGYRIDELGGPVNKESANQQADGTHP